ncbi:metallophosphoesterase [Agreia sp. PsM10]|uniref:metallophosphoesterase n=1 Tax=Agreia sp. PsM10 TaxID=3030533 RepID=UPI00263B21BB|nr:metallophosphoesterase [Agreia sp. PsM10]MDN4640631.1 metallophosphoesterase [Agreia sp. PsM10]
MPVIAHLSDPHLDLSTLRCRRLDAVLEQILDLGFVDALLVSGDLSDHGAAEEYGAFFAALPPALPTLVVAGNHDLAAPLIDAADAAGRSRSLDAQLNSFLDLDGLRLIGLDSHIDGRDDGFLSQQTLEFARARIAETEVPSILALHHPPVPIGHHLADDSFRLTNPGDLAAILEEFPQVIGVFAGHVHAALATTFEGVPVLGAPGIVSTMRLGSKVDPIADTEAMPGLALHTITDRTIRTVFHYLSPSAL